MWELPVLAPPTPRLPEAFEAGRRAGVWQEGAFPAPLWERFRPSARSPRAHLASLPVGSALSRETLHLSLSLCSSARSLPTFTAQESPRKALEGGELIKPLVVLPYKYWWLERLRAKKNRKGREPETGLGVSKVALHGCYTCIQGKSQPQS